MKLNIKSADNTKEIADFVVNLINNKLEENLRVLLFVSGGSAIPFEVFISNKISKLYINNLTVTLIDERYVPVDNSDSNWFNLKKEGFNTENIKFIPYLTGKDFNTTTKEIEKILKKEINNSDYKIGIFGIGIDGHTAGILPHTLAVSSKDYVCAYETELYNRITITPFAVEKFDQAIVYAVGKSKWPILEKLENDTLSIDEQPAQVLKKVPLLTIFTDYKAE